MQLSDLLKEFSDLDNDIKKMGEKMKVKRERKNQLSEAIIKYMKKNNINDLESKDKNSMYILKPTKSYSSISQKLLKDVLYKVYNEKDQADSLIKKILNERKETNDYDLVIRLNK